jgi:hypothetical protein
MLANILMFVGMPHSSTGVFPRKVGGMQVFAALALSSQTLGTLWLAKSARKMTVLN